MWRTEHKWKKASVKIYSHMSLSFSEHVNDLLKLQIDMSMHAQTRTHTTMRNTGAMSQSVSSWTPVGEGSMCPQDVAQLHNQSWSDWQRSRPKDRLIVIHWNKFKKKAQSHVANAEILTDLQFLQTSILWILSSYKYDCTNKKKGLTSSCSYVPKWHVDKCLP